MTRRLFLTQLALVIPGTVAWGQQRRSLTDPLRVGVDYALLDGGLAQRLQKAFGRDTGVAVQLLAGASSGLLEALERGELDATLTHAPAIESRLTLQGLAHDARTVAQTDFVIAGPLRAGVARGRDAAAVLAQIAQLPVAFLSRNDGSGTHLAEQALWRAAGVAPAAPWHQAFDPAGGSLARQAQARSACVLIDRGSLQAAGRPSAGWGVLAEGDARLVTRVQWLRTFRVQHPAAKLFGQWIAGPRGHAIAAATPGMRAVN